MKQLKLPSLTVICLLITSQVIESKTQRHLNDHDSSLFKSLRAKRQVSRDQVAPKQQFSSSQNGQAGTMVATMAASSGSVNNNKNKNVRPGNEPIDKNEEEISPSINVARPSEENQDRPVSQNQRPEKPLMRNPGHRHRQFMNGGENEEDCYDDYGDDYGAGNFFQLATRPMRQFGRIMNDMLNHMPMQDMNYDGMLPGRGASIGSSASAINTGDGFSRLSSSVTNNGRTRGIVSETRNGRTQTRRIERNNDEDTENQPSADYEDE